MDQNLETLIRLCLERRIPFVAFHLPGAERTSVWVQKSGRMLFLERIGDVERKAGFLYAPFHRMTGFPVVLFEPELILDTGVIEDALLRDIADMEPLYPAFDQGLPRAMGRNAYIRQVQEVRDALGPGLSKVVLSRVKLVDRPATFEPGRFFIKLVRSYPGAFVHLISIPGAGTWTGATPEMLLTARKGRASTMALAGTRTSPVSPDEPWGAKELEEQELVSQHVETVIRGQAIDAYQRDDPDTVDAGRIQHISTRFSFRYDPGGFDLPGFLDRLHPTPAVSGLPVPEALEVIRKVESHNREYYSGYCGPFDPEGHTGLFVNLRCMKVLDDLLVLYQGGGITAGSVPGDEWKETELKSKTLLNLI